MLRSLRPILAGALLTLPTLPVAAQEIGTVEGALLLRYSVLDDAAAAEPGLGFGGRLGAFLVKNVAIEASHAATSTADDPASKQGALHLHLARHFLLNERWTGILGAGWVRDRTNALSSVGLRESDGVSALLGLQHNFNQRVSLRFDAIYDYIPVATYANTDAAASNLHFQAGLVFRWPPPDSDGDGVLDRDDSCAATAAGTPVDEAGCPRDADRDGVFDHVDRCANTPAGTPVTAEGCPRDSDGDGVLDNADRCAGTAVGTLVDANGCPRDSDGDGVLDNVDQCGSTPAGTPVNAVGCPRDSDGDGVLDTADRCADTPSGTRVDASGCPLPVDSDGDGVRDTDDRCPNTPMGSRIDARGCTVVFEAGQRNIVLEGVVFETGRAVLTGESQSILDRVAESLVASPEVNVEVQGHTDNTGSVAGNNRISQARAEAVRQYLISKGVAANRLTARGYGPSQPKVANTTAEGRAQNRRVELRRTN